MAVAQAMMRLLWSKAMLVKGSSDEVTELANMIEEDAISAAFPRVQQLFASTNEVLTSTKSSYSKYENDWTQDSVASSQKSF